MGLGLHVLRDGHRRCSCFHGVGEHPHRAEQCGGQLFGAPDPVEVPRQRLERVVDGDVATGRQLEFLQDRCTGPGGEGVGRQQQHRQPVDGRQRGAGQHVRRAGADAGGDGPRLQPVPLAGVRHGAVHHGLLVSAQYIVQQWLGPGLVRLDLGLQQCLAEPGDVAVTEDAEAAGEELAALAVAFDVLVGQEPNGRLRDGESDGRFDVGGLVGHCHAPRGAVAGECSGSRGSTSWPSQLPRSQACSGSSTIFQARSAPGPAITFR